MNLKKIKDDASETVKTFADLLKKLGLTVRVNGTTISIVGKTDFGRDDVIQYYRILRDASKNKVIIESGDSRFDVRTVTYKGTRILLGYKENYYNEARVVVDGKKVDIQEAPTEEGLKTLLNKIDEVTNKK